VVHVTDQQEDPLDAPDFEPHSVRSDKPSACLALRSETRQQRFKPTALTPAVAYRKDVEKRKRPFGKDDGSWIVISTIVGHIGYAVGSERRRFLDDAAKMAAELFEPAALAYGCAFDPPKVDRRSSIAVLRLLAEKMENVGTLNLSTSLLEGLAGVLPTDSVNSGRVLAQRARLSWKMGKTDLALARYRHLRRKARKSNDNELLIRSWIGFSSLAQQRGNYPDVRMWSQRVVSLAEQCRYRRLAGLGHQGLMLGASAAKRFEDAIPHGWAAYQCRQGDVCGQAETLNNIAQLFYLNGHPVIARDAFIRVLAARPALNVGAAALGGYALSSAVLADERAVRWAAAEATSLSEVRHHMYESVTSLIECATALDMVGDQPYASVLRARASTMAQYAGFFELVYQAEESSREVPSSVGRALRGAQIDVAEGISNLPPVALPDRLELSAV
jgi:hypothetical protein